MSPETYKAFIREAFISPIRSVLIVDDDYPTIEEVLSNQPLVNAANGGKAWGANPKPILEVVTRFRSSSPALLVDVHDGSNVEIDSDASTVRHLHQTDLLVLDYQLDRTRPADGSKAIAVARGVIKNHNFNLVVVHTSEDLNKVFQDVLIGVLPAKGEWLTAESRVRALELLAMAEEESDDTTDAIRDAVAIQHYLFMRQTKQSYPPMKGLAGAPSFAAFEAACVKGNIEAPADKATLFSWAMDAREALLMPRMFAGSTQQVTWSASGARWIRTDTAFFAFTSKGHNADLLDELLNTLAEWNPRPSRLFLSKMRAAISHKGVGAETNALGSNHVLALWYRDLLSEPKEARPFQIAETVSRNTEQLMDNILPDVRDFAGRLVAEELAETGGNSFDQICLGYFGIDLRQAGDEARAVLEHNIFVCSKPVTGYHLATGHVLTIGEEVWACMSPMCDLVPGQGVGDEDLKAKDLLPFMAVKLQELPLDAPELKKNKIQSNRFVFLRIGSVVRAFSFNSRSAADSAPVWAVHYAKKQGTLPKDMKFDVMQIKFTKRGLAGKKAQATVVAQLRYEYALNLQQRLGGTMTRVGLDFASL